VNELAENLKQWAFAWVSTGKVEHGSFDARACRTCHEAGTIEPWRLTRSQGHVAHVLAAEKPLECSACHELSQHRLTPKPEECARCHSEMALFDHTARQMPGGAAAPCLSCHEFLARTDVGKKSLVTDCRRCHSGNSGARASRLASTIQGVQVAPGQIHANLTTCSTCHNPHASDPSERNLGTDCTRCHDRVAAEHHAEKLPEKFDCSTCHEVHGPRAELSGSCRSCHAQSTEPETTVAREHERCTQCHAAHEFVADEKVCTKCHESTVTALSEWKAEKHADCRTCHQPHDATLETARCAQCHQRGGHGHPSCTSCHEPHGNAERIAECGSCHQKEHAGVVLASASHRADGCATCHQPHAQGKELAACQSCHKREPLAVATAAIAEHQRCASCHAPHAFSSGTAVCSTCHNVPETGPHAGACKSCHEAHGAPLGRAKACANCHANITPATGAHAPCSSCHAAAHAVNAAVLPNCGGCHTDQATAVSAWPAPKHQSCSSCHSAHEATKPTACATCHEKLVEPVKAAGHRCSSCHDTHLAKTDPVLWSGCGQCHAGNAASAKTAQGPTHSACKACHEPHTAAAPTCSSCHRAPAALHGVAAHQRCASCHATHQPALVGRKPCLACHAERINHFPEANSCASCHLFK
jgi:hypothetical protein